MSEESRDTTIAAAAAVSATSGSSAVTASPSEGGRVARPDILPGGVSIGTALVKSGQGVGALGASGTRRRTTR